MMTGAIRGHGYSYLPTAITLLGICGFRVIWITTAFAATRSLIVLYLSYPISWVLTSILLVLYFSLVWMRSGRLKGIERPAGQKAPVW